MLALVWYMDASWGDLDTLQNDTSTRANKEQWYWRSASELLQHLSNKSNFDETVTCDESKVFRKRKKCDENDKAFSMRQKPDISVSERTASDSGSTLKLERMKGEARVSIKHIYVVNLFLCLIEVQYSTQQKRAANHDIFSPLWHHWVSRVEKSSVKYEVLAHRYNLYRHKNLYSKLHQLV